MLPEYNFLTAIPTHLGLYMAFEGFHLMSTFNMITPDYGDLDDCEVIPAVNKFNSLCQSSNPLSWDISIWTLMGFYSRNTLDGFPIQRFKAHELA